RPSASRTDRLPSQATMYPCWYIQRPATQMSRACCASVFACPGRSESGVKGGLLSGAENGRAFSSNFISGTPRRDLRTGPAGSLGPARVERSYYKILQESSAVPKFSGSLSIDAAQLQYRGHTVDRQHVRRDAVVDLVCLCVAHHLIEGILHNI